MNKSILIQSRLSSSRFPQKMLKKVNEIPLVHYVYNRCSTSKEANEVIVITSNQKSDDELYEYCYLNNIKVYRGDLDNVLKRYIDAANFNNVDIICRVCGDSPFVDIDAIDKMFVKIEKDNLEYIYTTDILNGFMSEVFTLDLLQKVYNLELTEEDQEHVTRYVRNNKSNFKTAELSLNLRDELLEEFTLTIDYPQDLKIAQQIATYLDEFKFTSIDVLNILRKIKEE